MAGWGRRPLGSLGTAVGPLAGAAIQYLGDGLAGHLGDLGGTHRGHTWTAGHLAHLAGHIWVQMGSIHRCGWDITTVAQRSDHVAPASGGSLTSLRA